MITVKDLVAAHLYANEDEALQDALRHLLRSRPDMRISLAIHRYQTEQLSLAQAASMAGVSWPHMRDILVERGVPLHLGPETLADAEAEIACIAIAFQRSYC
jgi:predicted HTH domain antitoxin